jgi:hypothetical protein
MAYIDTFVGFNIMAIVGLMLIIGVIIRAKIAIFQSFLILDPCCNNRRCHRIYSDQCRSSAF